ncbi:hypothetical protein IGJ01_000928 [Enterococcus sp. AZ089]|uniref:hypothetical protein n=1 Tax=Enterococcus sp. AZ089 TaxID=2774693 RepID=UPI003D2FDB44
MERQEEIRGVQEVPTNQVEEKQKETALSYGKNFSFLRPAIQISVFVLWRIHNNWYSVGSQLFYQEICHALSKKYSQNAYKEALAFLEGASVVVHEVVIVDKIPKLLLERYGISHE